MPFTMTMPKLSPTMEEGIIAKWHKKVGEYVEAGELLLEVSTDKATVEHQALDSGWLRKLLIQEDGEAHVNQPIAIFTVEKDENIEGYVPEGDTPAAAAPMVEKELKTALLQTNAPTTIEPSSPEKVSVSSQEKAVVDHFEASSKRIIASPLAKKLAAQDGLDLSSVQGSGPGGRIMKRDLSGAASLQGKAKSTQREPLGSFLEEPLTQMRKVIAQRLQEAKSTIPHFYLEQAINAENLSALREQLKNIGIAVTYNDLIIKASALALKKHPAVNSGFGAKGNSIVRFKTVDIAVAVSIEGGLLTPIVRYADDKDVREISQEVKFLSQRAKEGKLQPNEFQGGSFTISNLGMYGVSNFYAIINPPQAAILAVSGILNVPVVKDNHVVAGKILNLSLSVDHRVIDGVAAATFMQTLKLYLENPASLIIH